MLKKDNFFSHHQNIVKAIEIITLIIILVIAIYASASGSFFETIINAIKQQGMWGQALFIVVFACTIVLPPLPATPLKPVALLAWGFWPSYFLVIAGDLIGGSVCFIITRSVGHNKVKRLIGMSKYKNINKIIDTKSLRSVFELLFITNLTYDYTSYASGLSDMNYKTYLTASLMSKLIWAYILLYIVENAIQIKENPLGIIPIIVYIVGTIWLGARWEKRIKEV